MGVMAVTTLPSSAPVQEDPSLQKGLRAQGSLFSPKQRPSPGSTEKRRLLVPHARIPNSTGMKCGRFNTREEKSQVTAARE